LKLYSYWEYFFEDGWNVFDLILIGCVVLDKLVLSGLDVGESGARLVRTLRVLRVFRIVGSLQSLNTLTVALWKSCIEVGWVGMLAVIIM
jgi:hypothetical protein